VGAVSRIAAAIAVLAAAAAAAAVLLGHASSTGSLRTTSSLSAQASLAPSFARFGDPITARIAVLADRRAVDPSRIHVSYDLGPLELVGPVRTLRSTRGRTSVVEVDAPVACISAACTADSGIRVLQLRPAAVEAPRRGGGTVTVRARWLALEVRGRVVAGDLEQETPPFRAELSPPPATYRLAPGTLALLLDALAALLAAAGVAVAGRQALAWSGRGHAAADERGELQRALALARESSGRPPADRRRALGLLARLLGQRGAALSGPASELAWSAPQPSSEAVSGLVEDVAREVPR
jgi:hypothetical protein